MITRIGYLGLAIILLVVICAVQMVYGVIRLGMVVPPEPREFSTSAFEVSRIVPTEEGVLVLDELQKRPLFWQSRRPYEPPKAEPVKPEAENKPDPGSKVFKDTQLLGIYTGGQHPGVILLHKEKKIRLNQNETLEGWTLEKLNEHSVEFVNDHERYGLEIHYPKVKFSQQPNN